MHVKRSDKASRKGTEGIQQNTECQHATTSQSVSQPAAPQSKDATTRAGTKNNVSSPCDIFRATWQPECHGFRPCHAAFDQFSTIGALSAAMAGLIINGSISKFIDVKRKTNGSDDTDQPLDAGEAR